MLYISFILPIYYFQLVKTLLKYQMQRVFFVDHKKRNPFLTNGFPNKQLKLKQTTQKKFPLY